MAISWPSFIHLYYLKRPKATLSSPSISPCLSKTIVDKQLCSSNCSECDSGCWMVDVTEKQSLIQFTYKVRCHLFSMFFFLSLPMSATSSSPFFLILWLTNTLEWPKPTGSDKIWLILAITNQIYNKAEAKSDWPHNLVIKFCILS